MMNKTPEYVQYSQFLGDLEFPLFKFMRTEHAASILDCGEVRLPNMFDFKDENKYGGSIVDKAEGSVLIENEYTHYVGRAKDAEGIIPVAHQPYQMMGVRHYRVNLNIKSADVLIYCATSSFFSDTLIWAIGERKEKCVMIMDPALFFSTIHNRIQDEFAVLGPQSCLYIKNDNGKFFETNPTTSSETNFLLSNHLTVPFTKPKRYEPQREARTIFYRKINPLSEDSTKPLDQKTIFIPEAKDILREIAFENADVEVLLGQKSGTIYTRVHRHSGEPTLFSIEEPRGVFSPVVFVGPTGEKMLGFYYPNTNLYAGAKVGNCDVGVVSFNPAVFGSNYISNIKKIEIFTE